MGTNYYAVPTRGAIHIGKSSIGWAFAFRDQPEWHSFRELKQWLKKHQGDYLIIDEYDRVVDLQDFIEMVEQKQKDSHDRQCRNVDGYDFVDEDFF